MPARLQKLKLNLCMLHDRCPRCSICSFAHFECSNVSCSTWSVSASWHLCISFGVFKPFVMRQLCFAQNSGTYSLLNANACNSCLSWNLCDLCNNKPTFLGLLRHRSLVQPPPPPHARRVHRTTQQRLQRNPQEAELRYYMQHEQIEHDAMIAQWEAQTQAQPAHHPKLQPNPTPTTIQSELQPRAAPKVHEALQDNDPAHRPNSVNEAPLKKPPPSLGRSLPKGFVGSAAPPMIGAQQPAPPNSIRPSCSRRSSSSACTTSPSETRYETSTTTCCARRGQPAQTAQPTAQPAQPDLCVVQFAQDRKKLKPRLHGGPPRNMTELTWGQPTNTALPGLEHRLPCSIRIHWCDRWDKQHTCQAWLESCRNLYTHFAPNTQHVQPINLVFAFGLKIGRVRAIEATWSTPSGSEGGGWADRIGLLDLFQFLFA